jgi:hypothetical protein
LVLKRQIEQGVGRHGGVEALQEFGGFVRTSAGEDRA